jgi:hypothetical protein
MQPPENSAAAPARQLDPAQLKALVERVDALAEVPAGPKLAAALAAIDADQLTGEALVGLMVALCATQRSVCIPRGAGRDWRYISGSDG